MPCSAKFSMTLHTEILSIEQSAEIQSVPLCNSVVAVIEDLWCHSLIIRKEHGIQCMPCSSQNIYEMLAESHIVDRCSFLYVYLYL